MKITTMLLRYTGYLNSEKKHTKQGVIANSSSCTTTELSKLFASRLTTLYTTLPQNLIKDKIRLD